MTMMMMMTKQILVIHKQFIWSGVSYVTNRAVLQRVFHMVGAWIRGIDWHLGLSTHTGYGFHTAKPVQLRAGAPRSEDDPQRG